MNTLIHVRLAKMVLVALYSMGALPLALMAQVPEAEDPPGTLPEPYRSMRARVVDPNRKPYVRTEADDDPDVAKRPGLRIALGEKRILGTMYSPFDQQEFLDSDGIPKNFKDTIKTRWEMVVAPDFLPSGEGTIEWRGRDKLPSAPEQNFIAARWITPAGVLTAQGVPDWNGVSLCLQLSDDDRISFRFRAPYEGPGADRREDMDPQDILDKPRLLEILTTCFAFPFDTVKDFRVTGGNSGIYDGVRIFAGTVDWSRTRLADRPELARIGQGAATYNQARLFITDSEPQYFCIGVTLGQEE